MAIAHASAPDCRPELRLVDLDDIDRCPDFRVRWSDTLQRCGDIYYDLDYLRAAAAGEHGPVRLAMLETGDGRVIYPFVERPIAFACMRMPRGPSFPATEMARSSGSLRER